MKKVMSSILLALALLSAFSLYGFAEEEGKVGILKTLGSNIWYILLVIVFSAGLILVSKWSSKIKENDQKLREEAEKFQKENPEEDEETSNMENANKTDKENDANTAVNADGTNDTDDENDPDCACAKDTDTNGGQNISV